VVAGGWQVYVVNEVRDWIDSLDAATHARVVQAIDTLADVGPGLGRPLVDTIHGSTIANLVARQHPAGRRRQSRPLDAVVPRVDPNGRTAL